MRIYFKVGRPLLSLDNRQHVLEVETQEFLDKIWQDNSDHTTWSNELFKKYGRLFVMEEGIRDPRNIKIELSKSEVEAYIDLRDISVNLQFKMELSK